MSFKTSLRAAGIAALATLGFMQTASAANHEIYLGFRLGADNSGDNDMLVNLGLFSSLPTSGVITNINDDLTARYGANWNTSSTLFFGAAGANITGTRVAYASNFADGFSGDISSSLSALANRIAENSQMEWDSTSTQKGFQGINSLVSYRLDNSLVDWSTKAATSGGFFGNASLTRSEAEQNTSLIAAGGRKEFQLWSYTQGETNFELATATTFYLDSAGNIGVSAVPEPSTYGLMGAGALAAAALVRRRRKALAKVA